MADGGSSSSHHQSAHRRRQTAREVTTGRKITFTPVAHDYVAVLMGAFALKLQREQTYNLDCRNTVCRDTIVWF
jgi:hypothetical protein